MRLDSLAWLSPKQQALFKQVLGDRIFSSRHPAMQAVNPRLNELLLEFR